MSELRTKLVSLLARDEGLKLYAYRDSLGFLTIGYGRLIDPRRGGRITEDEALYLLQNDIEDRLKALAQYTWFQGQDEVRQAALADMSFNLGIEGLLHFPSFLHFMQAKDYPNAVAQLVGTPWESQVGQRAKRIEEMIISGAYPS